MYLKLRKIENKRKNIYKLEKYIENWKEIVTKKS